MRRLSPVFLLSEFIYSDTAVRLGIKNMPGAESQTNLRKLFDNVLKPLMEKVNHRPMYINSGYRSIALNKAIGGSPASQHCKGQAADIEVDGWSTNELFDYIRIRSGIVYDQIILEFFDAKLGPNSGWVHISWKEGENRMEQLVAKKVGGKSVYTKV